MSTQPAPAAMTDDETAAFAEQVFERARQGDADMLGRLLASGLPANLRNHKGDTLLMLASYHGHHDAVRVLLEHSADPLLANDNGQLPIAGAAFKGDLAMIRLLLEHGVPVDAAERAAGHAFVHVEQHAGGVGRIFLVGEEVDRALRQREDAGNIGSGLAGGRPFQHFQIPLQTFPELHPCL